MRGWPWVFSLGDAAGGGDKQAQPVGAQAGCQRRLRIAPLRADARYKQPGVRGDGARLCQRLGVGGADDQPHVRRPVDRLRGHPYEERGVAVVASPAAHRQFLEGGGARIGGVAEHEQPLALVGGEGRDAVLAQIGAERYRIHAEFFEAGARVGRGGGADVAPFGVQEHGDMRGDGGDGLAQEGHAGLPQGFIEGDVGLVTADQIGGGLDDGAIPAQQRVAEPVRLVVRRLASDRSGGAVLCGAGLRRRVQTDTQQRVVAARGRFQFGEK